MNKFIHIKLFFIYLVFSLFCDCHFSYSSTQISRRAKITGVVQDEDGKPVKSASVIINQASASNAVRFQGGLAKAQTDSAGRFELVQQFTGEGTILVRDVWVDAKNYISARKGMEMRLKDGQTASLNLRLTKGQPLAGSIRLRGVEAQRHVFEIIGKDFNQVHVSAEDGHFEVFVPPGEYTIRHIPGGMRWVRLKSGRRDLLLEGDSKPSDDKPN